MHDTTNTSSCDCGVATVPSETTVSRESRHDSKQLCNSERHQSDRDTRASTTKQHATRTKQRWDPTVRQNTADDNDNDTSCQKPAPCEANESPPRKKAVERPFYGRDSCDEKKSKNSHKKQKITGSSPRTHEVSALEASSSRKLSLRSSLARRPDGARRHWVVWPVSGQAQRGEILPFRNANGRFLSQRGCVVRRCQLPPNC